MTDAELIRALVEKLRDMGVESDLVNRADFRASQLERAEIESLPDSITNGQPVRKEAQGGVGDDAHVGRGTGGTATATTSALSEESRRA